MDVRTFDSLCENLEEAGRKVGHCIYKSIQFITKNFIFIFFAMIFGTGSFFIGISRGKHKK